jgi:hypothetical protein
VSLFRNLTAACQFAAFLAHRFLTFLNSIATVRFATLFYLLISHTVQRKRRFLCCHLRYLLGQAEGGV